MKKLLFIILFLFISKFAFCADINFSLLGTASGSAIGGAAEGTPSLIKDDSTTTYYGAARATAGLAGVSVSISFSKVDVINSVDIISLYQGSTLSKTVDLLVDGSWINILTSSSGGSGVKTTVTISGTWKKVTGIRSIVTGASAVGGRGNIYELRAWGQNNKGNQVITFF